jgi:hypothetical protein
MVLPALLPLAVLLLPLRAGTAPLAAFPVEQLVSRTLSIPGQLTLQLAWLADANTVLHPMIAGEQRLPPLWQFALITAVPLVAALVRWWRGQAGDGERMLVCATLGSVIAGAWLYRTPNQFQLALALEPFAAIAVAEQLGAWRRVARQSAAIALVLVGLWRAQSVVRGLAVEARPGNPMLSGRVQHAAVERLRDVSGETLVTTTYNQAGVLEGWTDGRLAPLNAWPVLAVGREHDSARLVEAWRAILADPRRRYILLSDSTNLYDSPFTDNAAVAAALHSVVADAHRTLTLDAAFPTERDTPGWSLWRLD